MKAVGKRSIGLFRVISLGFKYELKSHDATKFQIR